MTGLGDICVGNDIQVKGLVANEDRTANLGFIRLGNDCATAANILEIGQGTNINAFITSAGNGSFVNTAADFTSLADCPHSYATYANDIVVVNGTEDGLVFTNAPSVTSITTSGNSTLGGITTINNEIINGTLVANSTTQLNGAVTIGSTLGVTGTSTMAAVNATSITTSAGITSGTSLYVGGNSTMIGTLNVGGNTTLNSASIQNLTVSSGLTFPTNITVGHLEVTGNTQFDGNIDMSTPGSVATLNEVDATTIQVNNLTITTDATFPNSIISIPLINSTFLELYSMYKYCYIANTVSTPYSINYSGAATTPANRYLLPFNYPTRSRKIIFYWKFSPAANTAYLEWDTNVNNIMSSRTFTMTTSAVDFSGLTDTGIPYSIVQQINTLKTSYSSGQNLGLTLEMAAGGTNVPTTVIMQTVINIENIIPGSDSPN